MYNLIKPNYIVSDKDDIMRIINSNDRLKKLEDEIAKKKKSNIQSQDKFINGLTAEVVEVKKPEELLEEASIKYDQLLKEAQEQAQDICDKAQQEAQQIKKEAYDQGFSEGHEQGKDQIERALSDKENKLNQQKEMLEEDYKRKFDRMESQLVDAILSVMDKVLHIQISDKREIIYQLVNDAISDVGSCKEFQVYINDKNLSYLNEHIEDICNKVGQGVTIEMMKDPTLSDEQCRIETNTGTYICGYDSCYKNLVKDIKSLSI